MRICAYEKSPLRGGRPEGPRSRERLLSLLEHLLESGLLAVAINHGASPHDDNRVASDLDAVDILIVTSSGVSVGPSGVVGESVDPNATTLGVESSRANPGVVAPLVNEDVTGLSDGEDVAGNDDLVDGGLDAHGLP